MFIEELENVVAHLSPSDLDIFAKWFEEYRAEQWDKQIESDMQTGRFNKAGEQADKDFNAGRCTQF